MIKMPFFVKKILTTLEITEIFELFHENYDQYALSSYAENFDKFSIVLANVTKGLGITFLFASFLNLFLCFFTGAINPRVCVWVRRGMFNW